MIVEIAAIADAVAHAIVKLLKLITTESRWALLQARFYFDSLLTAKLKRNLAKQQEVVTVVATTYCLPPTNE